MLKIKFTFFYFEYSKYQFWIFKVTKHANFEYSKLVFWIFKVKKVNFIFNNIQRSLTYHETHGGKKFYKMKIFFISLVLKWPEMVVGTCLLHLNKVLNRNCWFSSNFFNYLIILWMKILIFVYFSFYNYKGKIDKYQNFHL